MNYQWSVKHVYVVIYKDSKGGVVIDKVYESENDAYIHCCKGKEDHSIEYEYFVVEIE